MTKQATLKLSPENREQAERALAFNPKLHLVRKPVRLVTCGECIGTGCVHCDYTGRA